MSASVKFAVAVHVLALLARNHGEPLASSYVAGSVNTNPVVVRRLLRRLQRAGFVDVRAGAQGGAVLVRSPSRIDLRAVYEAVEERPPFALHGAPNPACPVGRCITGVLEGVSAEAGEAMLGSLGSRTIADVVRDLDRHGRRARAGR